MRLINFFKGLRWFSHRTDVNALTLSLSLSPSLSLSLPLSPILDLCFVPLLIFSLFLDCFLQSAFTRIKLNVRGERNQI